MLKRLFGVALATLASATIAQAQAIKVESPRCTLAAGPAQVHSEGGTCGKAEHGYEVRLTDTVAQECTGAGGGTVPASCIWDANAAALIGVTPGAPGGGNNSNVTVDGGSKIDDADFDDGGDIDFTDTAGTITGDIKPNSISSTMIPNGVIQTSDIADGAIIRSKRVSCSGAGEIEEWDGDSWECITTPASGGDMTEAEYAVSGETGVVDAARKLLNGAGEIAATIDDDGGISASKFTVTPTPAVGERRIDFDEDPDCDGNMGDPASDQQSLCADDDGNLRYRLADGTNRVLGELMRPVSSATDLQDCIDDDSTGFFACSFGTGVASLSSDTGWLITAAVPLRGFIDCRGGNLVLTGTANDQSAVRFTATLAGQGSNVRILNCNLVDANTGTNSIGLMYYANVNAKNNIIEVFNTRIFFFDYGYKWRTDSGGEGVTQRFSRVEFLSLAKAAIWRDKQSSIDSGHRIHIRNSVIHTNPGGDCVIANSGTPNLTIQSSGNIWQECGSFKVQDTTIHFDGDEFYNVGVSREQWFECTSTGSSDCSFVGNFFVRRNVGSNAVRMLQAGNQVNAVDLDIYWNENTTAGGCNKGIFGPSGVLVDTKNGTAEVGKIRVDLHAPMHQDSTTTPCFTGRAVSSRTIASIQQTTVWDESWAAFTIGSRSFYYNKYGGGELQEYGARQCFTFDETGMVDDVELVRVGAQMSVANVGCVTDATAAAITLEHEDGTALTPSVTCGERASETIVRSSDCEGADCVFTPTNDPVVPGSIVITHASDVVNDDGAGNLFGDVNNNEWVTVTDEASTGCTQSCTGTLLHAGVDVVNSGQVQADDVSGGQTANWDPATSDWTGDVQELVTHTDENLGTCGDSDLCPFNTPALANIPLSNAVVTYTRGAKTVTITGAVCSGDWVTACSLNRTTGQSTILWTAGEDTSDVLVTYESEFDGSLTSAGAFAIPWATAVSSQPVFDYRWKPNSAIDYTTPEVHAIFSTSPASDPTIEYAYGDGADFSTEPTAEAFFPTYDALRMDTDTITGTGNTTVCVTLAGTDQTR